MTQRKHFSNLPSFSTINKILMMEKKYPVPKSKKNITYPEFTLFENWLTIIGVSTSFLSLTSWKKMYEVGSELVSEIVDKTLHQLNRDGDLVNTLTNIENYLGKEDKLEKTDVIIVFGSKDLGKVDKAFRLWEKGYFQYFCMSGRSRMDAPSQKPECEIFREKAIELGVPEDLILTEDTSVTLASNVRHSLLLFKEKNMNFKSIMTMVAWFGQRRAWCHLMKYTEDIKIVRVNSDIPSDRPLAKGNWYKNETGIKVIAGEFLKMKMASMIDTT
ncbi:YdcF family protein [Candidatus Woesebacteria bacterium]|nr:MAG: YdcF family protein [Candidatus Woesebacteria bacterium]